jgi:hypothetical protein
LAINERFRASSPSSNLEEAGLLLHQFDEIEVHGKPWEFCEGPGCYTQGATIPGRVSAMLIYHSLRDRSDRVAIPLPFGNRAGLIFRSDQVDVRCLYGVDGSTAFQRNDPGHPGCPAPHDFCNARDPSIGNWGRCGFDGWPIGAWRPEDLEPFMRAHQQHGETYRPPGFHSGYNEVILSSESINAHLPHSVAAFFVLSEEMAHRDGVNVRVAEAHRAFLERFGVTSKECPLLLMRPGNWEEPFVELQLG